MGSSEPLPLPLPAPVTLLPRVLGGALPRLAGTDGVGSRDDADNVVSRVERDGVTSQDEAGKVVSRVERK